MQGKLPKNLGAEVFGNLPTFVHLAQSTPNLSQLLVEQQEDGAFNRVGENEIVNLRCVDLAVTMDAPNALLQVHGIPRKVKVKENPGVLQIDAFPARRCAN